MKLKFDDGSKMTDEDIQEEVDTFMFEGHDTTTCAISWTIFLLGNHPEVQDKIFQEQLEIFGPNGQDTDVDTKSMAKMKYLECCIKESLRLYPSVPIIGRRVQGTKVIGGVKLRDDSGAAIFVHKLHRNSKVWKNPHEFNPERFMAKEAFHPYAYVPFSAGPRNCVGQKFAMMEEKTVLSKLTRKFKFTSLHKVEEVQPVIAIITRPYEGIRVKVENRA